MFWNIIYILSLLILAGVSKAVMDTVSHHFHISIFKGLNPNFWHKASSSNNKYKRGDKKNGPKFFLSTTVLVWTTDAWHLFQMIFLVSLTKAFLMIGMYFCHSSIELVSMYVMAQVLYRAVFELFHRKIFVS